MSIMKGLNFSTYSSSSSSTFASFDTLARNVYVNTVRISTRKLVLRIWIHGSGSVQKCHGSATQNAPIVYF
jgi:hypothetical protein